MTGKFVLVASHLALAANAIFEGASVPRQQRLRSRRVDQAVNFLELADTSSPPPVLAGDLFGDAAQLAFKISDRGNPEEVDKLEKMVAELVKKGEKDRKAKDDKATPLDPSVQYIASIIDTTMLPNREQAHKNDQDKLDLAVRHLRECDDSRNSLQRRAESAKASYRDASRLHKSCRMTEYGEWMEQNRYCQPTALEVVRLQSDATCAKVEESQKYKYCDYTKIQEAEMACDASKQAIVDSEASCDRVKGTYDTRKSKCDFVQSTMDQAACEYSVQMKDACDHGSRCFAEKSSIVETTLTAVQNDEVTRKAEMRALKRMKCLLGNFEDGNVEDSEIETCKEKTHETPSINYPEAPRRGECHVPDTYPGKAAYKEAEFKNLPPEANGNPSAGQCYGMQ